MENINNKPKKPFQIMTEKIDNNIAVLKKGIEELENIKRNLNEKI